MIEIDSEMILFSYNSKAGHGICYASKPRAFFDFLDHNYIIKEYAKICGEVFFLKRIILKFFKMTKLK